LKKLYLTSPDNQNPIPDFVNLKILSTCVSTNEYINNNFYSFVKLAPLLISAVNQTGGKGRGGRKWISVGEDGLYISYLSNIRNKKSLGFLSIIAGIAVSEAIKEVTGLILELKWPNDIEFSGLKVGGILIENKIFKDNMYSIIGIGINVNAKIEQIDNSIKNKAASLSDILGRKVDASKLTQKITEYFLHFTNYAERSQFNEIMLMYLKYLKHKKGDDIRFHYCKNIIQGQFKKINNGGGIVIKLHDGEEKTYFSGEIISSV